jgi:hypothetical protein
MVIYLVAIAVCAVSRWAAFSLYVAVAVMWLIPDRRLAGTIEEPAAGVE